ncbi:MAG: hypothetical protein RMJ28_02655 [Nitrososphaerota archaeon]|nr:hypothetical protein [Nitrososphaerota archaeon]
MPPHQPVLVPAAMLAVQEIPCIVVSDAGKTPAQITEVSVVDAGQMIRRLIEYQDVWRYLMRLTAEEAARPIPTLRMGDTLETLLNEMSEARVDLAFVRSEKGRRPRIVDLLTILKYYSIKSHIRSFLRDFKAAGICSGPPLVSVEIVHTLRESMKLAVNKGVRRLVVKPSNTILSLRSIVRFFFGSIQSVELLRDDPERILNLPVGELGDFLQQPGVVNADDSLVTVCDRLLASDAKCCLLSGGNGIITPWDLTVKLYQKFDSRVSPM